MKNLLLVIIILLSGLLIAQILMGDKRDTSMQQVEQRETVQPETSQRAVVRGTVKLREETPPKPIDNPGRARVAVANPGRESNGSLWEYNANLVREHHVSEPWDNDIDQARESNVSQAQIDIVKKREAAMQRRDELLKVRAETVKHLGQGG